MWEEVTDRRERSGPMPRLRGPSASTAAPARTVPDPASAVTPPSSARSAWTWEFSRTWAPRSIKRRRRPIARRAGCRVAKSGMSTPRRKSGESQRALTPAASSSTTRSGAPRAAAAATALVPTASNAGAVDTHRYPDWSNQASTSWSRHHAPMSPTARLEASRRARAGPSPKRSRRGSALIHSDSQKPPLRPLGPWPHTPPSSSGHAGAEVHQVPCRPHAREPPADDHHIGLQTL